jgi:hypothetical protein
MAIIIAAMQDLLLSFESSKIGWKTHESLKGCHPQSVTHLCLLVGARIYHEFLAKVRFKGEDDSLD